jgi:MFS family permease
MPRRALTARFPALALRDFRLLLAERLLAPTAFAFSLVGVAFAVLDTTGSTADLSYVLTAQIASLPVFILVGGVFADRLPPQFVMITGNLMMALAEGVFGGLVLAGHPRLWQMIVLESVTGTGMALFYPASQALLPRVVPGGLLTEANALSRLVTNGGQMGGAAVAGLAVAAVGPGPALVVCGVGMLGTIPMLLRLRVSAAPQPARGRSMISDLRDGWAEFRSRTWLWMITAQYAIVALAWYGGFQVLGPAAVRAHLGGPAAWGAITAAQSVGLIGGALVALRFRPRRPMILVAAVGGIMAIPVLALAMRWSLPLVCAAAAGEGVAMEIMMVQWTVALATHIPPGLLARVTSYDAVGSFLATPAGTLAAGPIAAVIGISATQYGAVALIAVATASALMSRSVRHLRSQGPGAPALASLGETAGAAVAPSPN